MDNKNHKWGKILFGAVILVMIISIVQMIHLKGQVKELEAQINAESVENYDPAVMSESTKTMEAIETPYCTLRYPAEYYQFLTIKENESENLYSQVYYCTFNDLETELFSLYFGETGADQQLGYVVQNGEAIPVSIGFHQIERDESWSEEEYYTVCVMQESVNDIIQSLTMEEFFVEQIEE